MASYAAPSELEFTAHGENEPSWVRDPMKITRILVYQVDLPLRDGSYSWSGSRRIDAYDSTVVRIETDDGPVGYGEACPLGPAYLPAYAAGVRAGLAELAPHLIGHDPTEVGVISRL